MPNEDMTEFWNTRGGAQWVEERDRYDRMLEPMGHRLLEAAAPRPGERVLDVGCGNGATTLAIARAVGPSGGAVGLDLSSAMLDTARRRAGEQGLSASFVEADAQVADLGEGFDVVTSRFGVMFFDDPIAAFGNLARSLRGGGRIAFVCWKDLFSNEWIAVPAVAIAAHVGVPDLPPEGAPGPFSLADPERIRTVLDGAGFRDVVITDASDPMVMGDTPADVVAFLARDEMGRRTLDGKDPDKVRAALEAATEALAPFATDGRVALGSAYWVVTATRP